MNKYHKENHVVCFSRIAVIVCLLFVPFFIGNGTNATAEELIYSMSQGDNPWNITERYLTDGFRYWDSLLRLNKISNPNNMPPGTNLRIPLRWLKIEPAAVQVRVANGNVQYIEANKTDPKPLNSKTLLKAGDKVMVSEGGNVVLEFSDKSQLLLGSGSEMELVTINKFSDSGLADTTVKLQKGRTETRVKTKNSRFQIKTPSANTAVRGTDFRVAVDNASPDLSRVEVIEGRVRTDNTKGNLQLNGGFGTLIKKDAPPSLPVKLLSKPIMMTPSEYSRELPVNFNWNPIEGAEKYRIQIFKSANEPVLILDKTIPIQHFSTSALEDGYYVIKVRAIDSKGLEGLNTEYPIQLDARPQYPIPISPRLDETVRLDLPVFEWSAPPESTGYHFLLSGQPDMSSPIVNSTKLTQAEFTPEQLSPGEYYWKIATLAGTKEGPFGQVQHFALKPAPEAPDLSKMSGGGDEENIMLHWQDSSKEQQFKIQLATDPEFKNILLEKQLENPEFTAERPTQKVYLRIKVVESDGFEGDWSLPYTIEPLPDPWYYVLIPTVPFLTLVLIAL